MHHFHPPEIKGAKNAQQWLATFLIWLAFEGMRAQGDARE